MRRPAFLSASWSEAWKASYTSLPSDRQASCDRVILALIKGIDSPGIHVKPILPDKHYLEARIGSGGRIVFRVEQGTIVFVDVVERLMVRKAEPFDREFHEALANTLHEWSTAEDEEAFRDL